MVPALSGISPIGEIPVIETASNISRFNILRVASRLLPAPSGIKLLKIQRQANGDVVLTLSGRLDGDSLSELSGALAAEPAGRAVVLDLKDVVLVDRDTVRFLRARERSGIALRNCPPYIRAWVEREEDSL